MNPSVAIGIDLGGTNLKAAAVDRAGRVLAQATVRLATEDGPDAVIARMARLAEELLVEASVDRSALVGVGVGAPGPLSHRDGLIIKAANLPGWVNVALRDRLAERVRLPVTLDNDGNAAAFGEFWVGAGKGRDDLVMLTLGTGVGGGVILNRQVLHGHFDNAAELGHMIVAPDGLPCSCGQRGCLEQYSSATAVARRTADAIKSGASSSIAQALGGGKSIDAEQVARCAREGDETCSRVWDEACRYLAIACVNIQHAYNPARVVLGGGMSEAGAFLLDRVRQHLEKQKWSLHDDLPAVSLTRLGKNAGVIGAAGLLHHQVSVLFPIAR